MKNRKYESEAMLFLRTLLNKPGSHEERMKLRATWWDKEAIDQEEQQTYHESEVKHDSYVYFSYPKH